MLHCVHQVERQKMKGSKRNRHHIGKQLHLLLYIRSYMIEVLKEFLHGCSFSLHDQTNLGVTTTRRIIPHFLTWSKVLKTLKTLCILYIVRQIQFNTHPFSV